MLETLYRTMNAFDRAYRTAVRPLYTTGGLNQRFLDVVEEIDGQNTDGTQKLQPKFANPYEVVGDYPSMRFLKFPKVEYDVEEFWNLDEDQTPVVILAPFAGHTSTVVAYDNGVDLKQSLVQRLHECGHHNIYATDYKSIPASQKNLTLDDYFAFLHEAIMKLGESVNLIGLCQGGWMAAMFAARYPSCVNKLVIAGAPMNTKAGEGKLRDLLDNADLGMFKKIVAMSGGRMLGKSMLHGWKSLNPDVHFVQKYKAIRAALDKPAELARLKAFHSWYNTTLDIPGPLYLQVIEDVFLENKFYESHMVVNGQTIGLGDITCPVYMIAGDRDDITLPLMMTTASDKFGTTDVHFDWVPGGHIGLFIGNTSIREYWPNVFEWMHE